MTLYKTLEVPSYEEFLKSGKIDLNNPEDQLKFAKVLLNRVIVNFESQEFSDAINLLRGK